MHFFQSELPYATWQEVQARIVEIQKEHQICIHKKELTELDIYHRILRFKNYMVCPFVMKCQKHCLVAELFFYVSHTLLLANITKQCNLKPKLSSCTSQGCHGE